MAKPAYRILPPHLHATAEAAIRYFKKEHGITGVQREVAIEQAINYVPTFTARFRDHHLLCVDVTDAGYTDAIDAFVLDCQSRALPLKLFIVIPRAAKAVDKAFRDMLRRAKSRGIGIVEVDSRGGDVLNPALSLSLTGLRRFDAKQVPPRHRQALSEAYETFRNGEPAKACATVYDELESLTRRLAIKADKKNLWKVGRTGKSPDFELGPWKSVLDHLGDQLDFSKLPSNKPRFTTTSLANIQGLRPHRNDSAHKPKNKADLQKRDRELRTRFEHAVDSFVDAVNSLRGLTL